MQPHADKGTDALFKYRALFDSNMLGVASTDFNDTILDANDAFLSMIGYTQEDLANGTLRWSIISPKKYDETDEEKVAELLHNRSIVPFEKEYIHKDGHTVPVLVGAETFDDEMTAGVCFALDISELKKLERKKDDFIGMVSHELKTPLSVMKLQSGFLHDAIEEGNTADQREFAKEIAEQIDKLEILITDLLNMARYQSDDVFAVSAIDVHDCVSEAVRKLALVHEGRTLAFEGKPGVFVRGNCERLAQVVTNFVNNAVRYSEAHTPIRVSVGKDERTAYIKVVDQGIGIAPENIEKIFERFYRVNHVDEYANAAAGIGLYVCNEIVKYHKGKITVESEKGKGSTFTIEIPLIR
jgi:PAS domain S-box-containing protein